MLRYLSVIPTYHYIPTYLANKSGISGFVTILNNYWVLTWDIFVSVAFNCNSENITWVEKWKRTAKTLIGLSVKRCISCQKPVKAKMLNYHKKALSKNLLLSTFFQIETFLSISYFQRTFEQLFRSFDVAWLVICLWSYDM